eukprot:2396308-Pyramimonas_sp.AAC.1
MVAPRLPRPAIVRAMPPPPPPKAEAAAAVPAAAEEADVIDNFAGGASAADAVAPEPLAPRAKWTSRPCPAQASDTVGTSARAGSRSRSRERAAADACPAVLPHRPMPMPKVCHPKFLPPKYPSRAVAIAALAKEPPRPARQKPWEALRAALRRQKKMETADG